MSVGERSRREDGELSDFLKRIQAGDEGAARELLQRFEAEVRLVVRRQLPRLLRSRFDSLDFLQSVWGSFFRRMRTAPTEFEDSRHLVAFLARAAKNKVIDEYRRSASRKHDMHREEPLWVDGHRPKDVPDSVDSPSEIAQAHEVFGRLRELVPEEKRSILEMKAEGLSSKDIGERLGISERTVQRVLEDLRKRMETEWESP
jgi:RNA polymerase sigma factor (sigma-70 family)